LLSFYGKKKALLRPDLITKFAVNEYLGTDKTDKNQENANRIL
jgi:hypothetical protein